MAILMNLLVIAGIVLAVLIGFALLFKNFYKKVEQGQAMIINNFSSVPHVTFTGGIVLPVVHKKEFMNISLKTIEIDRRGKEGLICQDNIRADIKVTFFVRVNKTKEDVLKVAQAIGCERASTQETIDELFSAKFSEALKTVGKRLEFEDLYAARDRFRDEIIQVIGKDLNGYVLEDAAIDYLEQTPIESLDNNNILDAQGIRKITELTAIEHIATNEFERDEETRIKKRDVEAREKILELERIEADAEARQEREIAIVRARETAEKDKVAAEERLKAETARMLANQELQILNENAMREQEVAENNRKRAVAIEEEKVTRVRNLEIVSREREVAIQEINKEKDLEVEKKHIADVIRERIAVERTVAEQEEKIEEVRVVEKAKREKQAEIIAAEARAEERLIAQVKDAEAREITAGHIAKEKLTIAEAEREAASKEAEAKIRLAEGIREEAAAQGLAQARVAEETGMAEVRVKEADAKGEEEQAMVQVKIQVAEADAIKIRGAAEAEAKIALAEAEAETIRKRYNAEATGLAEKFQVLSTMDTQTREHEEYRLQLDLAHAENMRAIDANLDIAEKQAQIFAEALKDANFDIVGGEGKFFENFMTSLSIGQAVDSAVGRSNILQGVTKKMLKKYGIEAGGVIEGEATELSSKNENESLSINDLKALAQQYLSPKTTLTDVADSVDDNGDDFASEEGKA